MQTHDDDIGHDEGHAGYAVEFDYDHTADAIVCTVTRLTDGGRTSTEHVTVTPVNAADPVTLQNAIAYFDTLMLDELCEDDEDNLDELRTAFRSLFMPLQDAVDMGAA